jgi:hypothetical protein
VVQKKLIKQKIPDLSVKMKRIATIFIILLISSQCHAQQITVAGPVYTQHPRFLAGNNKEAILRSIQSSEELKNILEQTKRNIEDYVKRCQEDSAWMVSRLQMYWKTKSTEIYIKGGVYDHAAGEAPMPTVKFPGMRGGISAHTAPKLEDIMPYVDDPRGLYLLNKSTSQMEWVDIAKTGTIIEGINNNIMRMAYTSSVLYFLTAEEKYARFAFTLFDAYMTGMYYRKEPYDLSHGHHQTLAGLSSFEVIQEVAILNSLTGIYDFLHDYLRQRAAQKMKVYSDVFRKWADLQIAHGVAFNNWNLMQAKNVLNIALILDDDKAYADKKGNQYYTNYILNTNSQRQWSLQKTVNEGYDPVTGLWNESAGYSLGVLNDLTGFVNFFDKYYKLDLVEKLPVLKKAVVAVAQYLFPSGYFTSFGDSHYGRISLSPAGQMLLNAQRNHKPGQAKEFTACIKALQRFYKERGSAPAGEGSVAGINALLYNNDAIEPDESTPAGNINDYITPVFSSPQVSFFALRNGMDAKNGLMVAMSGSKGNHMHAGGISMEIYGKGYVLGPESGIGTNYFQADYAEYYSQFPAHNTVAVDGISAYPVMKSNHGFEVKNSYPASGVSIGYFSSVSFGNLYFLEPETNADQSRLTSIIRTSDSTGYYVDIFRSKRKDGKDKMHDYFYHNIGQQVVVSDDKDNTLSLQPTDKLSFGGGHLFAYDYFYDKRSIATGKNVKAVFRFSLPGKEEVQMNMWMKGEQGRELFEVKSPKSTAIDRMGLPKEIAELPMPTIVARQTGEAWSRPFTVVFEPTTVSQPASIASINPFSPVKAAAGFVGLEITGRSGDKQFIFSDAAGGSDISYGNKKFAGTYGVINESRNMMYLFLANGNAISREGYSIASKSATTAVLEGKTEGWFFASTTPFKLSIPVSAFGSNNKYELSTSQQLYKGKRSVSDRVPVIVFDLPAISYSKFELR